MCRETSRVSFLMCPFCVRALLTNTTTDQGFGETDKAVDTGRSWLGWRGRRGQGESLRDPRGDCSVFCATAAAAARDEGSGCSGSSTSCTDRDKDKHVFRDYGFSIASGSTIKGIEVRLDAKVDSTSGSPKLCVQLSWNGGSDWTSTKSTATLSTSESTYTLGSASDRWGRSWSLSNLSNSSFRVRVISVASSSSRDFSLDWVSVRVHY
jgi:hypothetical protein